MPRPAQFKRDEVVEKAMRAFWDHGYGATSLADLVEVTDLNPGSLYAAFQSKEGLFLAALDHYGAQSAARLERTLTEAAGGRTNNYLRVRSPCRLLRSPALRLFYPRSHLYRDCASVGAWDEKLCGRR
jgi:AcrR family transcriptional regulator